MISSEFVLNKAKNVGRYLTKCGKETKNAGFPVRLPPMQSAAMSTHVRLGAAAILLRLEDLATSRPVRTLHVRVRTLDRGAP